MRLLVLLFIACTVILTVQQEDGEQVVYTDHTVGLSLTDHARTMVRTRALPKQGRMRHPIVYFYSRGGREIHNRGAEVFHQLHHAVRREGIVSFLEEGVSDYATIDSQYIDDYTEIFDILGEHDHIVVTAIPHSMDSSIGALLPPYSGVPFLANRSRITKWQIGYSFPSMHYFVDEGQHMICDTYFLSDVMGCVKEAYIRAPPLPLYYEAAARALEEAGGSFAGLKERLVLYDNDHGFDFDKLQLNDGCMIQKLDGMSREDMFEAYKKAVVLIDLWLPGAETVTAEAAMFDVCILVPNEMNGGDARDFPIKEEYKIRRQEDGGWNYTQISVLLNRALDEYDGFIGEFAQLKQHVMELPAQFQADVHRYFSNDMHFVVAAFSEEELALALPCVVSVLMNYPLASIEVMVANRIQFGLNNAPLLERLRERGLKQSVAVVDGHRSMVEKRPERGGGGPYLAMGMLSQRGLTCFADVYATLLRPDALSVVEVPVPLEDEDERESASSAGTDGGQTALECFATSEYTVIPLEEGWANMERLPLLSAWDGYVTYQAHSGGELRLGRHNCAHLEEMFFNAVYRGLFPYFAQGYRRFVRHALRACGVDPDR